MLLFTATSLAQEARYFPQIGDGFLAAFPTVPRFRTSFIFVNTSDLPQQFSLEFFDGDGAPLEVTLDNVNTGESVTGSVVPISLGKGESVSLQTPGTRDPLVTGYARFTVSNEVGGTAVFSGSDVTTGTVLFEAGVPATEARTQFSLFVDSLGNQDTGLALVGAGQTASDFTLTLYDTEFQQIATTDVPLGSGRQLPRFINQFFAGDPDNPDDDDPAAIAAAMEMQGSVTVTSGGPLAAVTLRQLQTNLAFPDIVPTLTTFPVIPGSASDGSPPAAQGRFAAVASGKIRVDLKIGKHVESVLLRFYQNGQVVDSVLRRPASGQISEYFLVPPQATERVTVQLHYTDGGNSPEIELEK